MFWARVETCWYPSMCHHTETTWHFEPRKVYTVGGERTGIWTGAGTIFFGWGAKLVKTVGKIKFSSAYNFMQ